MKRHELKEEQWNRIKDMLPPERKPQGGRPGKSNREMLNAMIYWLNTGIPCRDLLERQLERSGFDPAEACEPTPEQLLRLLDYRDDRCRILFENIKLERTDSAVVIQGMAINAVLMR